MDAHRENMYEIEFPTPQFLGGAAPQPSLIVALHGYADAGNAVEASSDHLLAALEHAPLVTFNNDELMDYRSRRPAITIDRNTIAEADRLDLAIRVVRDSHGHPFLVLSGPEPDMRWEAFTSAVTDLVERFDVSQTYCLYAAPMTVPHTSPMIVSGHTSAKELLAGMVTMDQAIRIPGSAALHLEHALGKRGHKVVGLTAHVPHYLAAMPYPQAALSLLQTIAQSSRLEFPLGALEEDAKRTLEAINEQFVDSQELGQVVEQLEERYDDYVRGHDEATDAALLADSGLDEALGDQFERFLAELDEENKDTN